jgi:hypothetical protein
MQWQLLEQPAYSLDFTPHGFLIFGPLKKAQKSHSFTLNDNVQEHVVHLWGSSPRNYYWTGYTDLYVSVACL